MKMVRFDVWDTGNKYPGQVLLNRSLLSAGTTYHDTNLGYGLNK
ncbi:hypothetical protein PJ311_04275 [Bacillus sp. CLL-7-23]|uniref:Uncharacterized protein n=1 Tax=Bacillus changyiensis TaxID=3004103 RepID=A0ABT4X183_9BACI|nr:hypothetical protein [Bacillus changyiensis]MDA7025827.1 hypothetical protein [Bacillus changyiensis]